ncbi:MAG: prepilin-type N-terminal cleavage/methylation domain-containing protein [bacterium]
MVGTRATVLVSTPVDAPRVLPHGRTSLAAKTPGSTCPSFTSPSPKSTSPRPGRRRTGLTLVEVLVAAAILAVAALAALEFLASSDAAALAARREAMAAVEAERALAEAAEIVRQGRDPSGRRVIEQTNGGETLAGCTIEIRAMRDVRNVGAISAGTPHLPIARLIAEVTSPDGTSLSVLERVAPPTSATEGAR